MLPGSIDCLPSESAFVPASTSFQSYDSSQLCILDMFLIIAKMFELEVTFELIQTLFCFLTANVVPSSVFLSTLMIERYIPPKRRF
jgi:hypothetical protein